MDRAAGWVNLKSDFRRDPIAEHTRCDPLGSSPTATLYSIKSLNEAQEYLLHPILGVRLRECTETVLAVESCTALGIFGYPDDLKFKSSMTLFEAVAGQDAIFSAALGRYFNGERDSRTLELLQV
ncbi:MAG: DUF1810 family protein [Pyrinomonadaceae bacterium]